jgi:hypothetical protein
MAGRRALTGGGRVTFEWYASGAHLLERGTAELPEAPDSVSIIGCDAANGTYFQLYSDERGVCRVYEMSIGNGEWKLWREGEPFSQRFTATLSDDGNTITGRWEIAEDGTNYTTGLRPAKQSAAIAASPHRLLAPPETARKVEPPGQETVTRARKLTRT